ncbi:Senecionine N-oxygenase [Eumeta japonica]|uniref:Flavin-containing monooxygenase n=1 Tax=Eumeta variegata TaxID=151549 RepID=A0A4C1XUY9_EUMVA|nr:Senecionine N-oxygenase [Eumeta japonica]
MKTRVCIVGAGIAGLSSARHLQGEQVDFVVLESTNYVGGTWRYDPRTGKDENGLPLHTSMYKHLRTNLPKQAMELYGFPIPEDMPSFPSWKIYYEYIKAYTKYYNLYEHIKFLHEVTLIKRKDNVWQVSYRHVITNEHFQQEFDYVLVCTGHFSKPNWPDIPGQATFRGKIIHSHDYREPCEFKDKRVLVVGAGPSGMDIGLDVAEVSRRLIHSHHLKVNFRTPFPSNFIKKPDIKELTETGAIFVDGSFEEIDSIIYCTGFEYYYPFLDESSGLTLDPHHVTPLYRYMVNVRQPTMLLLGLVVRACVVAAINAQARYAAALVVGNFTLPPEEVMMKEWQQRADAVVAKGRPFSDIHLLAEKEDQYYADLSAESGIDRVPPVLFKIRTLDTEAKLENLYTYRDYVYTIVDNDNFIRRYEPPAQKECCGP